MIRFLRTKFRGSLDRKRRRLHAELEQVRVNERRLARKRKKIMAQVVMLDVVRGNK